VPRLACAIAANSTKKIKIPDACDAHEVAELLHMPLSTVLDLARRGVLPGHKLGRRWIFLRDELELGLRHAPSRNGPQTGQQPPAREAAGPPRRRPKRYPEAVPSHAQLAQPRLFG
jgi:excisionase family DNA binding protein